MEIVVCPLKILLIHQSFPGQFKHLAPALAQRHAVRVLTLNAQLGRRWQGIAVHTYTLPRGSTPGIYAAVANLESQTLRAEAAYLAARAMQAEGYTPDLVLAHPGWGESLFLKEVWPHARLGIYAEFYYHAQGADVGFDPEFPSTDPLAVTRLRMKNVNADLHFLQADGALSPTHWQASTFPAAYRERISVIHDGIDTEQVAPNPAVSLTLNGQRTLTKQDEIITFVNRNLEPYRGYHIFMRALPEILRRRPKARVLIVGGDGVSYGAKPANGQKWKDVFAAEVRPQIPDADWARVHFLGNIAYQHFVPLLQLSTVHVYLTYPFVLSWSLLEAMSAGCAIVASDTLPLHEAIAHDETGRLVNFFDVAGLAGEVCALLDDPAARQRLGRNARAFAQATYDLKRVCLPRQLAWVEGLAPYNR